LNFSIVARCARTGQLGVALAGGELAAGRHLRAGVRPNVGATHTQGRPNPRNNRLALNLLAQGFSVSAVMHELAGSDPEIEAREIAIVDRLGEVAVRSAAPHRVGAGYAILGPHSLLAAAAAAYEADPAADLDERLLGALEAASLQGARAAALVLWGRRDFNDLDLRVDSHPVPVVELRRVHSDVKPTIEFYDARARNPRMTMTGKEFAENLKKGRM
jgi:uncharacterized Ntn-hydrolase superfamily protein